MTRRYTIALVGIDGAGKTTQARWLADWLTAQRQPADYLQNASGRRWLSRLAQRFGRADGTDLVGPTGVLVTETVLRFLAIARSRLRARLHGHVAVMDRYALCQYAMIRARAGGGTRGERFARFMLGGFPEPDLVCFLAVPPHEACRRVAVRATDHEELADLVAADAAYHSLPEAARMVEIDAAGSPIEVQARIRAAVAVRLPDLAPTTHPAPEATIEPAVGPAVEPADESPAANPVVVVASTRFPLTRRTDDPERIAA
jgi:dTMP kinase